LALVALDLVDRAAATAQVGPTLSDGLVAAARMLAEDPVVRAVAQQEPAVVGRLLRVLADPVWDPARQRLSDVAEALAKPLDDEQVDLVLRWLVAASVAPPLDAEALRVQAERLLT
jgi:hypothetical protein